MSADQRTAPRDPGNDVAEQPASSGEIEEHGSARARRALRAPAQVSPDTRTAIEIRGLVERGEMDEARQRFEELVTRHQRRASRIAFQYLRDVSEADEAVQDAFVKVFTHIGAYREAWPFEVWFTRILINGCLDRRKAQGRRDRWFVRGEISPSDEAKMGRLNPTDPERQLLARERRARLAAAVDRLDGRQRTVFMLSQYGDCTPKEISAMTGLKESTVRVHLFRAARKLRALLGDQS